MSKGSKHRRCTLYTTFENLEDLFIHLTTITCLTSPTATFPLLQPPRHSRVQAAHKVYWFRKCQGQPLGHGKVNWGRLKRMERRHTDGQGRPSTWPSQGRMSGEKAGPMDRQSLERPHVDGKGGGQLDGKQRPNGRRKNKWTFARVREKCVREGRAALHTHTSSQSTRGVAEVFGKNSAAQKSRF